MIAHGISTVPVPRKGIKSRNAMTKASMEADLNGIAERINAFFDKLPFAIPTNISEAAETIGDYLGDFFGRISAHKIQKRNDKGYERIIIHPQNPQADQKQQGSTTSAGWERMICLRLKKWISATGRQKTFWRSSVRRRVRSCGIFDLL